jgi:hypothetical protein
MAGFVIVDAVLPGPVRHDHGGGDHIGRDASRREGS